MGQKNRLYHQFSLNKKALAVLIDPDSFTTVDNLLKLIDLCVKCQTTFFFLGGSLITKDTQRLIIDTIKNNCQIPVILFPGSNMHIAIEADGILFLSLISGRNPELLIGQHVASASILKRANMEVLPTGYLLINGGNDTAVSYMSGTTPIPKDKHTIAVATALAGELLGMRLIYMDAGSGAKSPISSEMIQEVKSQIQCPLVIGGGINTVEKAVAAFQSGADTIVIGNAIEKNPDLILGVCHEIDVLNKKLLKID